MALEKTYYKCNITPEDREDNEVMGLKLLSGLWATGIVLFLL